MSKVGAVRLLIALFLITLLFNLVSLTLAQAASGITPAPLLRRSPASLLPSPIITGTKTYTITTDTDSDSQADAGDVLSYTIVISNDGSSAATGVTLSDTLDANTGQSGLVSVSPIAFDDSYNAITHPVTLNVPNGVTDIFANDYPGLNPAVSGISSFGGGSLPGNATTNPAPGTVNFGGGGSLTVNPNGSFNFTPAPGFQGVFTFLYRLQNPVGPADGLVSLIVDAPPKVVSTNPVSGATGIVPSSNITVNFSESVTATLSSFSLECPPGSPRTFSLSASPASSFILTPTTTLPGGVVCEVTVLAAQVSDADGNDPPDTMESNYVFNFTVPPDAVDDTYGQTVIGNVSINSGQIPYSVTGNDNSGSAFTITAFGASSAQGGQVSMTTSGANMGQFTYNPPPGYEGTDSFTYTIGNAAGSDTATVTLTVAKMIWFIDNSQASNGDGRLSSPFNNLAAFHTINNGSGNNPAAGDNIFIYRQVAGSYSGGLTLLNNQRLVGQGASASLAALTGLTVPSGSATLPATGGISPTLVANTHVITLANSNTIDGFFLQANSSSLGSAGLIGSNVGGTTVISEVAISTSSNGNGLILTNQGGSLSFSNGSISGSNSAGGVGLTGGTGFITFTNTPINRTGGGLIAVLNKTGGGVTFSGGTISGSTLNPFPLAAAIVLQNNSSGTLLNLGSDLNISTSSGSGISASGNSGGTQITFGGASKVLNTGASTAVSLATNTGATISFTGGGLDLDTTGGTGFTATGGGTINVTGAANNIDTDTGIALDLNGVTIGSSGLAFATANKNQAGGTVEGIDIDNVGSTGGGTLAVASATIAGTGGSASGIDISGSSAGMTFTSVTVNNTTGAGMALTNNTGAISVNGGTVGATDDPSGNVVDIDQGNAAVTIAAALTKNTAGRIVEITGRTGGTVDISGNLACSSTCTGINVQNNTSGSNTLTFSGGTKTLNTGGNPAVTLDNNDTATITFSNGGLDIDTTSGIGFNAINGATGINVTTGASPNTIDSTTGTALNVVNTSIGAADLTFRRISAGTGAGSSGVGIILNSTGNLGGLHITGDGTTTAFGNGSGGTIQHKTGADGSTTSGIGIYLNNTAEVQLSNMNLHDFDNHAIFGTAVNSIKLTYSTIGGTIGTSTGSNDAAIAFGIVEGVTPGSGTNGLTGASLFDSVDISGAIEHNFEIYETNGNADITVQNSRIHDNSVGGGSDGLLIETFGSTDARIKVDSTQFFNNKSQAFQLNALRQSSIDLIANNNTVTRGTQGNEGFVFSNGTDADLTVAITNNNFSGWGGVSVYVGQVAGNATPQSLLDATISGNIVTTDASATNHAIIAFLSSTTGQVSQARLLIDNNNVTQNANQRAILVDTPDSGRTPEFHATVTNNTTSVADTVAAPTTGIAVNARNGSTGHFDVRLNDANQVSGGPGVRVRQATLGIVELARGISGSNDPATVLTANNLSSITEILGTITVINNGIVQLPATPTTPTLP